MRLSIKYTAFAAGCLCALAVSAQDVYSPALEEISRNSTSIAVLEREYAASVAGNATGLTMSDPEVEAGYLFGHNDRKDLGISQSFDFPTVYSRRRELARTRDAGALSLLKTGKAKLLLEAKELLVDLTYVNAVSAVCRDRLEMARELHSSLVGMEANRNATLLDVNAAFLELTDLEEKYAQLEIEKGRLVGELALLNGGKHVAYDNAKFPLPELPADFQGWLAEAETVSPELGYLRDKVSEEKADLRLSMAEGLPKFSVGYSGEFIYGENLQGVKVGISVPLWENRGKVKWARSRLAAAELAADDARLKIIGSLRGLHSRLLGMIRAEKDYSASVEKAASERVLKNAFDKGAITLHEYLEGMQKSLQMKERLLEMERDREIVRARLYAHTL